MEVSSSNQILHVSIESSDMRAQLPLFLPYIVTNLSTKSKIKRVAELRLVCKAWDQAGLKWLNEKHSFEAKKLIQFKKILEEKKLLPVPKIEDLESTFGINWALALLAAIYPYDFDEGEFDRIFLKVEACSSIFLAIIFGSLAYEASGDDKNLFMKSLGSCGSEILNQIANTTVILSAKEIENALKLFIGIGREPYNLFADCKGEMQSCWNPLVWNQTIPCGYENYILNDVEFKRYREKTSEEIFSVLFPIIFPCIIPVALFCLDRIWAIPRVRSSDLLRLENHLQKESKKYEVFQNIPNKYQQMLVDNQIPLEEAISYIKQLDSKKYPWGRLCNITIEKVGCTICSGAVLLGFTALHKKTIDVRYDSYVDFYKDPVLNITPCTKIYPSAIGLNVENSNTTLQYIFNQTTLMDRFSETKPVSRDQYMEAASTLLLSYVITCGGLMVVRQGIKYVSHRENTVSWNFKTSLESKVAKVKSAVSNWLNSFLPFRSRSNQDAEMLPLLNNENPNLN